MYARILTASLCGLEAETTWVEVDCENGMPGFSIVGLANLSIKEAKDRIQSSVRNCGYSFPAKRITVNLTPAGRKKEGSHYDLPIALGLLLSSGQIPLNESSPFACFGEMTLDGRVTGVDGLLPMMIGLQKLGVEVFMVPKDNLSEAMLIKGASVIAVESLLQAAEHISGFRRREVLTAGGSVSGEAKSRQIPDFSDIRGQERVKRAALLAAAGRHGMLMIGPPGVGKSMIGRRIPGILPEMSYEEMLDVTRIYSIAGELRQGGQIVTERPFRAPHHSLSSAALVGGGSIPRPGEISLAHRGVLFLDELAEFQAKTLDMLRQPLEEGRVSITRVSGKCDYPADFMLVAATNPCRCGWYGDPVKQCSCSASDRKRYISRISGPLLDRIDIHVVMDRVVYDQIESSAVPAGMNSEEMRRIVENACKIQEKRFENLGISSNSKLSAPQLRTFCSLNKECSDIMRDAYSSLNLSARSYHRILKVARTAADLDESSAIEARHLLEALSYRLPEKYFS